MNFENGLPFCFSNSEREMDGGRVGILVFHILFYTFHECPTLCSFRWNGWKVKVLYLLIM